MGETILFIHGTGVREESYRETLGLISQKVKRYLPAYKIEGCPWGEVFGARLNKKGESIPGYANSGNAEPAAETADLVRWQLLARDPLLELRVMPQEIVFGQPPGPQVWALILALRSNDVLAQQLAGWSLEKTWGRFLDSITANAIWGQIVNELTLTPSAASDKVARALVAGFLVHVGERTIPCLTGTQRDELVSALLQPLGGPGLGLGDWLLERLTSYGVPKRGWLADATTPTVGDILRYQARGAELRSFIDEEVRRTGATVVLAHSLGGIAAVDWLATGERGLKALVTVGSQAAYFYEIDALVSRRLGAGLPEFFPRKWMNFVDSRDFLSYPAQDIFKGFAIDVWVDNAQPFPESHSAYWHNDREVWTEIGRFLR
jgi:hypothetical protein